MITCSMYIIPPTRSTQQAVLGSTVGMIVEAPPISSLSKSGGVLGERPSSNGATNQGTQWKPTHFVVFIHIHCIGGLLSPNRVGASVSNQIYFYRHSWDESGFGWARWNIPSFLVTVLGALHFTIGPFWTEGNSPGPSKLQLPDFYPWK